METAIGVFAARERAEEAVKRLLEKRVPNDAIVYLTLSESEAKSVGKQLGAYAGGLVGGAAGLSAGVAAATLLAIPGLGPVFALGFGAAALLGLVGAGTGAAVAANKSASLSAHATPAGSADSAKDAAYFRQVLNEGHSLIVVRTESAEVAAKACEILDALGISMKKGTTQKNKVTLRELGDAVVVDVVGRIALADGTAMVRDTVRMLVEQRRQRIVLNLADVDFIDSAGLGELVRMHASVRSHGGQMRIVNPNKHVGDLLRMTKLDKVLEIEASEAAALSSFEKGSPGVTTAH
jgi:anti-sigma B factor antagonist